MKRTAHSASANDAISYAGYRFPPDVISYAVWLYYRFPLSLRMVEELLAARGIELTYETVRRWSVKFGLAIARRIRSTALALGDKWHLDEVVVTINGKKHWLWRAVDQDGAVLDVLMQSRRDTHAAKRLMRKLLKKHGHPPRVLITDKLESYAAANGPGAERGTPAAQRTEQPGGKFASANAGAREGDAPLQIGAPLAALYVGPRSGGKPVHALPLQRKRARETAGAQPGL